MENSNSISSSSSPPKPKEYDVFLSFRGEDTRNNFTGHVRNALRQKGIHTFFDDDKLERGKEISPELLKAIEDSYSSIVILSENYASSGWCLTELAKIIECMGVLSGKVLPIFYHVDPGHVRSQSGSYGEAFKKHERDQKHSLEKVQSWRDALKTVGNLAGWHVNDTTDESKFIQDLTAEVSRKLSVTLTKTLDGLYGMHSRLKKFDSFLCRSSVDVRFIGICGTGGIGKTTLAKAYYNQMFDEFEARSFLENVREVCEKKENGRVHLQKQLLADTLKDKAIEIGNVYDGAHMISRRLRKKNILIVLDDVDKLEQIQALAEKNDWFGPGSVVIVTTRDESLLTKAYKGSRIYKVEQLNDKEALQLFSLKAFPNSTTPLKDYKELSEKVIEYADGLPLALEVLGSLLCGKSKTQWAEALERLKKYAEKEIVQVLRISFDDLRETDQQIFLDIACFFNGYDKDYVIEILESCELYPTIGISTLVDKSLLSIRNGNKLSMHDLLQEMGKDIVRQESRREPGRRSRIWDAVDFKRILQKKTGTDKLEGIQSFLEERTKLINFEALSNLKNLRLLMIFGFYLSPVMSDGSTPNLEYLSDELRLLEWNGFPYKDLPSSFEPNELVHLKLTNSNIQQLWNNPIELDRLKTIDLSNSRCFSKFEDFEMVPNLEKLILKGCIKLSEIHPSITVLGKLTLLNLQSCTSLENLPRRIKGLNSLKILNLHSCSKLCELPEDLEELKSLEEFDVTKTGLEHLPPSIFLMGNLKTLCCDAIALSTIRTNIINRSVGRNHCFLPGDLSSFNMLNLSNCNIIDEAFPGFFGCFVSLVDLDLSDNPFSALPPSINRLSELRYLNLKYCKGLRNLGPELPSSLKTVWVDHCSSLNSFLDPLKPCQLRCSAFCVDCFELVKKQDSKTIAFSSLKRFLQDPLDASLGFEIVLPGSEIPAWFMEQSSGSSINIQLSPNWCSNKWIGLALSVCFRVDQSDDHIYCEVESRNWRSRTVRSITNVKSENSENHLWLFYLPRENFPEDWNSCSNLEFSFYAKSTNNNSYCGPFGVRLVYEKDIERFNQIGSDEFSDQEDVCSSTSKRVENMMIAPTVSNRLIQGGHVVKILDLSDSNLSDEAFPDFGNFVFLEELNLSNNPFSILPSSISRLSKLRDLDLKNCEGLRYLGPELPCSLENVRVDYCSSLNSFLDPSKPCHLVCSASCLNCFELVKRQDSKTTAMSSLKRFLQDPLSTSRRYNIVVPGSEIPTWFTKQSSQLLIKKKKNSPEQSVSLKVGPNWCNEKWMGFALSLCFRNACQDKIFCDIKINGQKWGFGIIQCPTESETSDHLWLCYLPRGLYFRTDWQNSQRGSHVISFSFYTNGYEPDFDFSPCGPCGVRLVYEKDIQEVTQN